MSFTNRLNEELNYYGKIKSNCVSGKNGINVVFYTLQPENIFSSTGMMQCYKMNNLAQAINRVNSEYSFSFYDLQMPFEFDDEIKRLNQIEQNNPDKYFQKCAEVYKNTYEFIAHQRNEMRKHTYILAVSSPNSFNKINYFFDTVKNLFLKAGITPTPSSNKEIQFLFNKTFSLPNNWNKLTIGNQEIKFKSNKYEINNFDIKKQKTTKWCQIINIKQTSENFIPLQPFWLSNIFDIPDIFTCFDICTLPEKRRDSFITSLKTDFVDVKRYRSDIKREKTAHTREIIEDLIIDIAQGKQDVKLIKILIKIEADTEKALRAKFIEVKKVLDNLGLVYGSINYRQHEAIELLQPFRENFSNLLSIQKDLEFALPTDAIGNSYPFTQISWFQKHGNLIGTTDSDSPIIFNLCDSSFATNRNCIVLGTSGSRKTTLLKTIILSQLMNDQNQQVLIMDFENEYTDIAKNFNQQIIEFTKSVDLDAPNINIFQIPYVDTFNPITQKFDKTPKLTNLHEAFNNQLQYVSGVLRMLLSRDNNKLSINEINVLETEITELYKSFKITKFTDFNKIPNNKWPIIDDLADQISKKIKNLTKKDVNNSIDDYITVHKLLTPFTNEGMYAGIFNRYTNIEINEQKQLVVFNLYGLLTEETSNEVKVAMLMSVLRYWNNIMLSQRRRYPKDQDENAKYITFIVDEFHKLVDEQFPQGLRLLSQMYSQLRKYYSQIIVATQSISTFTDTKSDDIKRYLKQMIDNSCYKFIMGMGERQLQDLNTQILYGESSELTEQERYFLATNNNRDGGRFVLIVSDKERLSGWVYSASDRNLSSQMINVPFNQITEPIQLWSKTNH